MSSTDEIFAQWERDLVNKKATRASFFSSIHSVVDLLGRSDFASEEQEFAFARGAFSMRMCHLGIDVSHALHLAKIVYYAAREKNIIKVIADCESLWDIYEERFDERARDANGAG